MKIEEARRMAIENIGKPGKMSRELGRVGTAGTFIVAFGLLWVMLYFVILTWMASFLLDGFHQLWAYTSIFGWMFLLAGGITIAAGSALMLADWKRREPGALAVPATGKGAGKGTVKGTSGMDTTGLPLEHHIEA